MARREVLRCIEHGNYRFVLEVKPRGAVKSNKRLLVIMKNPSTADSTKSDPTIGKVEAWAKRHGYGTVIVLNLFALRSAYPSDLNILSYKDTVGNKNDDYILSELK